MLLYVGAGTDMSPLLLPHQHFVFIDQCPSNTTGHMGWKKDNEKQKYIPVPYKHFYRNVRQNMRRLGFKCKNVCIAPTQWEFTLSCELKTCRLTYFVNTVYPYLREDVAKMVARCDALFVRGYTPRSIYRWHLPTVVYIEASDRHNALRYAKQIEARVAGQSKWTSKFFSFRDYTLLQHGVQPDYLPQICW